MTATLSAELERLVGLAEQVLAGPYDGVLQVDFTTAASMFLTKHKAELLGLVERVNQLEHDMANFGIVELAVRNPSVADYCKHWEQRAEAAEQRAERAERDARRYAWLRHEHARVDPLAHVVWKPNGRNTPGEWVNTSNLDQEIDAALAARGDATDAAGKG